MFGYNRKKRPVELGPYPLETLKRDPSIIKIEAASVAIQPDPMPIGHNTYLVEATKIHLGRPSSATAILKDRACTR